ncbi:hypothetical protein HPB50_015368 [Hyalomma asiaticum]|uniref:Uncharacterized protein n=1 Tax=Hyalomma asiaticum TaxID=266040 RepID=A0ACB7RMX3_HYAAI|nr:hypothetical protein HPB50_015368 [Hyalomma asiaticum]
MQKRLLALLFQETGTIQVVTEHLNKVLQLKDCRAVERVMCLNAGCPFRSHSTHVQIKSSGGEDAEVFRNRKGVFSAIGQGGMTGCLVVLLSKAGSPRLSVSDGHTSTESAPTGCSSLLVPCEDAGLLRGGRLLGTVVEAYFASTLSWLTPTLVEAFGPP